MVFTYPTVFFSKSQTIATALRFGGVNQRLQRTPVGNSANLQQSSHSFWFRVPVLGIFNPIFCVDNGTGGSFITINTDDKLEIWEANGANVGYRTGISSMTVEQDTWHHGFISIDNARAGISQVVRVYIDGVLGFAGNTNTTNSTYGIGTLVHSIGYHQNSNTFFDGDLAIMHWVDGVAYEPTDFADTIDGVFQAKQVTPTYGIHGHFLPFVEPDDIGADFDNGNDWTLSNITGADLIGDGPPTSY